MIQLQKTYQLMNKDCVVLEYTGDFTKQSTAERFILVGSKIEIKDTKMIPYNFVSFDRWIAERLIGKNRMDLKELFTILGIDSEFDYAETLHAVSLNDTYWVRLKGDLVTWNTVSPYRNELDARVCYYAFTSTWNAKLNSARVSPEYTTGGSFAKCWTRQNGKLYLCKYGTSGYRNAGLEPYSELYANQLAEALGIATYTRYTLHKHNDRIYSMCALFTDETYGIISLSQLISHYNQGNLNSYKDIYNWLKTFNLQYLERDFSEMILLDCLTMNVDRHTENISVFVENDTKRVIKMSPIYDNNLTLLPYWEDNYETLQEYLAKHAVDNSICSKFGDDFVNLGRQFLTADLRKKLINIKDFEFKSVGSYNMNSTRLKSLSMLVREQIQKILQ